MSKLLPVTTRRGRDAPSRAVVGDEGREGQRGETNLLHDTGLALGEGDVATRLIRDELDLDLSPLTTGLVIVVVVVVGGRGTLALEATTLAGRGAIPDGVVVEGGGGSLVVVVGDVGHGGDEESRHDRTGVECEV
jgi:hypothetical protein